MSRWYKRCGADFIHGTMMLTLEEKGAYSLCLDLIYDRGGPIPDDARWLSGVCGVSIRKWNAIRERLLSLGKLVTNGELLSNRRADLEILSSELQRRNQAESGAKGGRKRAENAAAPKENSDLAQATLKPIEEIREEEKDPPNPPRKRRGEGKHLLPLDWELPSVAELPEKARACAEQWTDASYATHGEAFVNYWRGEGKMKTDWRLTWANRIVDIHSKVMRDQKFGNAPDAPGKTLSRAEQIESFERHAATAARMGRDDEAQDFRKQAAQLRLRPGSGPPRSIGQLAQNIAKQVSAA